MVVGAAAPRASGPGSSYSGRRGEGATATGVAWPVDGPRRRRRPSRRAPGPDGASDSPAHTAGRQPSCSRRAGLSALPQPRGTLAAGAAPVQVAGGAPTAAEWYRRLPAGLTRTWGVQLQRALNAMAPPVLVAHPTAPVDEPLARRSDPSTDPAGTRHHPSRRCHRAGGRSRPVRYQ